VALNFRLIRVHRVEIVEIIGRHIYTKGQVDIRLPLCAVHRPTGLAPRVHQSQVLLARVRNDLECVIRLGHLDFYNMIPIPEHLHGDINVCAVRG